MSFGEECCIYSLFGIWHLQSTGFTNVEPICFRVRNNMPFALMKSPCADCKSTVLQDIWRIKSIRGQIACPVLYKQHLIPLNPPQLFHVMSFLPIQEWEKWMSVVVLLSIPFVGRLEYFPTGPRPQRTTLSLGLNNYPAALTAGHHRNNTASLPEKPLLTWLNDYSLKLLSGVGKCMHWKTSCSTPVWTEVKLPNAIHGNEWDWSRGV